MLSNRYIRYVAWFISGALAMACLVGALWIVGLLKLAG